jgi:hypothetical protein
MRKTIKIIKCRYKRIINNLKAIVHKTRKFINKLPVRLDNTLSKSLRSKK